MPFTLSHPAAVLPLARRPFDATALVAGAIAPDLPYYARALPVPVTAQSWYEPLMNATTSHTPVGALSVGLPYALLLTAAWWAARRPLGSLRVAGDPTAALGAGLREVEPRRAASPEGRALRAAWVLLSLVVGIATHLAWDSFTHSDGYVVTHVPALTDLATGGLTWARLLQHASTVAGLAVLALYLWRRRSALRVRAAAVWTVLVVVVSAAAVGAVLERAHASAEVSGPLVENVLRASAETAVVALCGAAAVYVAAWWASRAAGAVRPGR